MKKTLVISNACFSDEESNGRTLKNLFNKMKPAGIAQFFVYGKPDFKTCSTYYQVTDRDALHSLIPFRSVGGPVGNEKAFKKRKEENETVIKEIKGGKTPLKVLLREIVWLLGRWKNQKLWKWIEDFRPEIILLFIANNTFLIRLAIQAAKRYHIPIVVYSTEGYSFMDFNYFTNRPSAAYRLYYRWLCMEYKKVSSYTVNGFFNNTLLSNKYETEYGYPCRCIMNSSEIEYIARPEIGEKGRFMVSYLGNLGLGRYKALIEIANTLQEIDKELYLEVYGKAPSEAADKALAECKGIRFHGFVSYTEVVRIIHKSSLLVHAEYNDATVNRDLKYAFSTKIADYICSGTPMLLYANEQLAETVFLKENHCAFIAHDKNSLKEVLLQAVTNEEQRKRIIENAKKARDKFMTGNSEFIQTLI